MNDTSKGDENMAKKDVILGMLDDIEAWAREGMTETEMCTSLHISRTSWLKYKSEYPQLQTAIDTGYAHSIKKVEAALFKAAVGYSYDEITTELRTDSKGVPRMVETKRVKKESPPNVQAIMNILKNKGRGWDAVEKIDIKGKIENRNILEDVPTDDVAKIAAEIIKKRKKEDEDV